MRVKSAQMKSGPFAVKKSLFDTLQRLFLMSFINLFLPHNSGEQGKNNHLGGVANANMIDFYHASGAGCQLDIH